MKKIRKLLLVTLAAALKGLPLSKNNVSFCYSNSLDTY